jgi:hypothetical protein
MTSVGEVSLGVKLDKSGLVQQVGQVQQEVASNGKAIALLPLIHRLVRRQQVPQSVTGPSGQGKAMVNI